MRLLEQTEEIRYKSEESRANRLHEERLEHLRLEAMRESRRLEEIREVSRYEEMRDQRDRAERRERARSEERWLDHLREGRQFRAEMWRMMFMFMCHQQHGNPPPLRKRITS
jgi:hypothetical protein